MSGGQNVICTPWLAAELYQEAILHQALVASSGGASDVVIERSSGGIRLCVRTGNDTGNASHQLLELITRATRIAIEQALAPL